jgi:Flp pilus assembly protein TadG
VLSFFLFGMAGLAVDLVYAYVVKAKLVTAVDAAALACARALPQLSPGTESMQESQLEAIVSKLFTVNFPDGYLMSRSRRWEPPDITNNGDGTRTVSIMASVQVPTFFMRILGYDQVPLSAAAKSMRRDVNVVLVLDRSGSLVLVSPPAWDDVQAAAKYFVDQFDEGRDRLGLVSFGTGSRIDYPPTSGFKTPVRNMIDIMQAYSGNRTNSSLGLWDAYTALTALPDSGALNVIVFFTDGQPTGFLSNHNVRTSGSVRCLTTPKEGVYMTDQDGGPDTWGLFQRLAAPAPTPNPDRALVADCTGLNSSGSNVSSLVTSFRSTWEPNGVGTTPSFSINGPLAVSTTNVSSGDNVKNISYNLTLNVASYIRQSARQIRIFSIGLGGYLYPADDALLQAVSNDPVSPTYNPNEPTGLYVYAPDQTQLSQAFQRVASEVSRLVQ